MKPVFARRIAAFVAPAVLVAALAVPALPARAHGSESWNETWTSSDAGRAFAYILVDPVKHNIIATGTERDLKQARNYDPSRAKSYLWLRDGDKRYVIADAALVQRARTILEPQLELGELQSRLGDMQSRLGDEQSELGDEQARLGDWQASLGDKQAALADRAQDASSADGDRQREWQKKQAELSDEQNELGRRQELLGRKQAQLGRDQAKLGAEQARYGAREAEYSATARKQMKALLEDSLRAGNARKV